jgi:Mg2+/Co2+ transporter CorC
VAPDEALVDAKTNIEDVNARLGLHLPHEDFETLGGLTVGLFGHLPHEGEEVGAGGGVRLRVDRTRGRRILALRVFWNGRVAAHEDQGETRAEPAIDAERV